MSLFKFNNITRSISALLCVAILSMGIAMTPITPQGQVKQAHASGPVWVIGGTGTIQQTLSAAFNKISAISGIALKVKELSLDPIAYALAKAALRSITDSIVRWINSGFQGSPAFVTDLKQYMLNQADQIAGQYIYNDPSLNFLCSPFKLDVKIALATSYQNETRGGGTQAQCTLSDVTNNVQGFLNGNFSDGGWSSWFQVTQNPVNTPTGAFLAAKSELNARITQANNRSAQELSWGKGFLSFKVCSDTAAASGAAKNCSITTPGSVIANQLNKALGAGQDTLVSADEVNEIIGALFQQLAKTAITGVNGLLGLGGGGGTAQYTNSAFGSSGSQSYLDALNSANSAAPNSTNGIITDAITTEQQQISVDQQVANQIQNLQNQVQVHNQSTSTCSVTVIMPADLIAKQQSMQQDITNAQSLLTTLQGLKAQYDAATTPQQQMNILNQYQALANGGTLADTATITEVQIYLQYTLPDKISTVQGQLNQRDPSCFGR